MHHHNHYLHKHNNYLPIISIILMIIIIIIIIIIINLSSSSSWSSSSSSTSSLSPQYINSSRHDDYASTVVVNPPMQVNMAKYLPNQTWKTSIYSYWIGGVCRAVPIQPDRLNILRKLFGWNAWWQIIDHWIIGFC